MLSISSALAVALGLLSQGQLVKAWRRDIHNGKHVHLICAENSTVHEDCVTVFDTTQTAEITHYVNVTVNRTVINTIEECITESTTTTLLYTVLVTQTAVATVTDVATDSTTVVNTEVDSVTRTDTKTALVTVTDTETDSATVTHTATDSTTVIDTETALVTITNTDTDSVTITETDSVTITDTATTTTTVPTTTYTTRTVFSTTYDPCPKSCSISAATVNLYFWPTDRPYTYPTTYVDPKLGYTFTSPSVYMLIPTALGIDPTNNATLGPSTTSWVLPLTLGEVSTIAPAGPGATGDITRQLTLSDLGTDCPQTVDPTAIATLAADPRCDPVLAAPREVRSWAAGCNACGRFGLFDPPYAIPTLTGGLVEPTTTETATATEVVVTVAPPPPVSTSTGGTVTETETETSQGGTEVSTAGDPTFTVSGPGSGSSGTGGVGGASSTGTVVVGGGGSTVTGAVTSTGVATAAAGRVRVGEGVGAWWIPVGGVVVAVFCL